MATVKGNAGITLDDTWIDADFRDLLPKLAEEERQGLKEDVLQNGVYSPLIVWPDSDGKHWLVDGHHRRDLYRELLEDHPTLPEPAILLLEAESKTEVLQWIFETQARRRNLTPNQLSEIRGKVYNVVKADKKTNLKQAVLPKGHFDPSVKTSEKREKSTAEVVAKNFGVSPKTVKRDGDFAKGLEKLDAVAPDVAKNVRAGKSDMSKADVEVIGKAQAEPALEDPLKAIRKPFNSLVKRIGDLETDFLKLKALPGGEFVTQIQEQDFQRKAKNLQEVVKHVRPKKCKTCDGEGCTRCLRKGYVREN